VSTLTTTSLVLGIAIALWCGWYCRRVAREKGRPVALWTVAGVLLNVVAVPVLLALPAAVDPPAGSEEEAEETESTTG
jgi:hypothetical protein